MIPPLCIPDEHAGWLRDFQQAKGRVPRILHIGNIANNAYLNSKILNRVGLASDVICHNYYHVMGWPEWEDSEFAGDLEDQFFPAWEQLDLRGFRRPRWFAQGPVELCTAYLTARRDGQRDRADWWWEGMRFHVIRFCARMRDERSGRSADRWADWASRLFHQLNERYWPTPPARAVGDRYEQRVAELCELFAGLFPGRADQLRPADLEPYSFMFPYWEELCRRYDVIIGYSTEGIYPLLCRHRPYFAFEHGTIRQIPFDDTAVGRVCALTYRLADGTFITNCDNIVAAERLHLSNHRFLPHPLNEDLPASQDPIELRRELCARLKSDFLIFHPPRQHWEARRDPSWEKGNDILIEGFGRFVKEVCPTAGAVFVEWGNTIDESKRLLERLGVADRVHWVQPLANPRMISYVRACNVLADQFFLGSFGSTLPKALMQGIPAMLYVDEDKHRWCFPEMPPVLNTRTPEQVFEGLSRLYRDAEFARDIGARGESWYRRYHSNQVILEGFLGAMRQVLAPGRQQVRSSARAQAA